ncbi:hypothetical protein TNCT_85821 [Trichonephila clavata]|uniref:Uncharacterized protein n=1 Tax=Trichonephila clavata TaxID=2740835 RepID=A0A8X6KQW1_TRICU|nr:hypothetical protein TNCT_85821 [Trichonephila clavata]
MCCEAVIVCAVRWCGDMRQLWCVGDGDMMWLWCVDDGVCCEAVMVCAVSRFLVDMTQQAARPNESMSSAAAQATRIVHATPSSSKLRKKPMFTIGQQISALKLIMHQPCT